METFSTSLSICAWNSPVPGEFPAQRAVSRSFDVSLICARINSWVNNREAGELRRHRAHYDVIVILHVIFPQLLLGTRRLPTTRGHVTLIAIIGITTLVFYHLVKPPQLDPLKIGYPLQSMWATWCNGKVDISFDKIFLLKLFFLGFFSVCLPNVYFYIVEYLSTLDLISFVKSDL